MPYSPEYLELWGSLAFENEDKRRLYSYQTFQGRDRKRQTDELFWRNSNELGLDLSGIGFVIDNTTGEIELVFDDSGDNPAELFRWLTFTDGTNSIDAASGADIFTFEGLNDATVTVDPTNKKVSIDVSATGSTQNLIETLNADSGSFTAADPTDSFDFVGDNGIVTRIVGDVMNISGPASHSTFVGNTGTYTTTAANQSFRILGGTDISTTVSANSITIDFTGSTGGTSLWDENAGTNSLYPATIGRKVGMNTSTPDEQFTVEGDVQFQADFVGGQRDETLVKFKNTSIATGFTTLQSNASKVGERYNSAFVLTHEDSELVVTEDGEFLFNNSMLTTPQNSYVVCINVDETDGPKQGLEISSNQITFSSPLVNIENTAVSKAFSFQVAPDGSLFHNGYASGNTTEGETTANYNLQDMLGVDPAGRIIRAGFVSGATATSTNALGEITVTHGCPKTPSCVIVTKEFGTGLFGSNNQTLGEQIEVIRGTIGTTTFKVKITDTSGAPVSNKIRQVYFIVMP